MSKGARFFGVGLALGVVVLVGRWTVTLGQTASGRLTIVLTNVVEEPIVDYEKVRVPVAPAAGATCTVPVVCYCGPALLLGVEDCGSNFLRIESSTDLVNWAPFPAPGFQLTIGTNSAAVVPLTVTNRFFRGVSN